MTDPLVTPDEPGRAEGLLRRLIAHPRFDLVTAPDELIVYGDPSGEPVAVPITPEERHMLLSMLEPF